MDLDRSAHIGLRPAHVQKAGDTCAHRHPQNLAEVVDEDEHVAPADHHDRGHALLECETFIVLQSLSQNDFQIYGNSRFWGFDLLRTSLENWFSFETQFVVVLNQADDAYRK